jgi:hypothetical protein
VNSTESNIICASKEQIDSKINGGFLSMYSTNYIKVMNDLSNPVHMFMQDYYNSIGSDFSYTLNINLKQLEVMTDTGFMLENFVGIKKPYFDKPDYLFFNCVY